VEVKVRYDTLCGSQTNCVFDVNIPDDMDHPIYFYYELRNFYQNHRRYVKSRADPQLRGVDVLSNLGSCDPLQSWDGNGTNHPLYPCGLIANSFFNDTFFGSVCKSGNCSLLAINDTWLETDIAWPSDKKEKFKLPSDFGDGSKYEENREGPGGELPLVTNEHFIVWMRTAGLPNFKKLYARLPKTDFKKGDVVRVNVTNVFPVSSFKGEKLVVISTTSWLGGKNDFLGLAYIVVGCVCLFFALIFFIKNKWSPRNLGDMKYFNFRKPN